MRKPTPETTSIMKTLSGSTRMERPTSKSPALSHVQRVDSSSRSSVSRPVSAKKVTSVATNEMPTDAVARYPAARREMDVPARVIASEAASGESRQIQAAAVTSPAKRRQLVHVELEATPRHGHDQPQSDHDLRGGDGHDGEREHLPVGIGLLAGERDQGQVGAVEHDLEREQDDQRAAAQEHAECAGGEEERGDRQIPGDVGTSHSTGSPRRMGCGSLPRMTPPTAATRRTIEVISKASRWSVRKMRPISRGLPNRVSISASSESRPPALRPIATTISTRSAAAAPTAASDCQLGPPAQGASARPPRYAITNRNM